MQKGKRRLLLTTPSHFRIGQRKAGNIPHGGGGPENAGAQPVKRIAIPARQGQPPTSGEAESFGEYGGYAAVSTKPHIAGIPANNFRKLGDLYGGRQ